MCQHAALVPGAERALRPGSLPGEGLATSALHAVSHVDAGCWKGVGGAGCSGHHGIDVSHGASNLVNRFSVSTRFVHDISVEWFALGTAVTNGRGDDLNLDLHRLWQLPAARMQWVGSAIRS